MPHRKNLKNLSSAERGQLADLMGAFLNDNIIREHEQVFANNDHSVFFQNHRTYIGKLEAFLVANGGEMFVPLPFWNDDDDIPSSFLRVEPLDNGHSRPDVNSHWAQTPRHHRLPDAAKTPQLCDRSEFDHIPTLVHEFEQWHQEVHALMGPVMALGAVWDAPAAYIFWPWHAYNDEIYHRWERCRLRPVRSLAGGRNADGRTEAFALGKDGRPWHCWREPQGTYAEWSLWHRLDDPGELLQLAVGSNQDGRLEVFAIAADGTLHHNWQVVTNGPWSGWHGLGGTLKRMALGTNLDGRLEIFGIGTDDQLCHIWQVSPNNGWSGWEAMGSANTRIAEIAVGDHRGQLEVFALTTDGRLFSKRQTAAGQGPWAEWQDLSGGERFREMTAGKHGDGHLQLFAVTTDDRILYKWRRPSNGRWSGAWRQMGDLPGSMRGICVARNADAALEVFVIGSDGKLLRNRELIPGASISWSGWQDFVPRTSGQAFAIGIERFTVVSRADGSLEIFAALRNDVVWHTWQTPTSFLNWERWHLL